MDEGIRLHGLAEFLRMFTEQAEELGGVFAVRELLRMERDLARQGGTGFAIGLREDGVDSEQRVVFMAGRTGRDGGFGGEIPGADLGVAFQETANGGQAIGGIVVALGDQFVAGDSALV